MRTAQTKKFNHVPDIVSDCDSEARIIVISASFMACTCYGDAAHKHAHMHTCIRTQHMCTAQTKKFNHVPDIISDCDSEARIIVISASFMACTCYGDAAHKHAHKHTCIRTQQMSTAQTKKFNHVPDIVSDCDSVARIIVISASFIACRCYGDERTHTHAAHEHGSDK